MATHRLAPRALGLLLALVTAGLLASGCGGGGDNTFEGEGYSFSYPGDWQELEAEVQAATGNEVASTTLGPAEGANTLVVTVYDLDVTVDEANFDQITNEVARVVGGLFEQAQGSMTAGPSEVSVAGLRALRVEGTSVNPEGVSTQSRLTFVFDGSTEYFFNCQFTEDRAEEMQEGCDQALDSFQVSDGSR